MINSCQQRQNNIYSPLSEGPGVVTRLWALPLAGLTVNLFFYVAASQMTSLPFFIPEAFGSFPLSGFFVTSASGSLTL
jgi:hypothetical protein